MDHAILVDRDSRKEVIAGEVVVDDARGGKSARTGAGACARHEVDLRRAGGARLRSIFDIHIARGSRGNGREAIDAIAGGTGAAAGESKLVEDRRGRKGCGKGEDPATPGSHRQILL